MAGILSNLPVQNLNEENDYLDLIDKGNLINAFLTANTSKFDKIKMFSLFGEWGSGKSTLMLYLADKLKKEGFNTFFFEAWRFEKDSNLTLSMLEYVLEKSKDSTGKAFDEIWNLSGNFLRRIANGTQLSVGLSEDIGVKLDIGKMLNSTDGIQKTFLEELEEFEVSFKKWETLSTSGKLNGKQRGKWNIIFIDDLDRCEPENVLNLLASIKLFFTYGERTIFLCGIDKKAVDEAVKTKYGDVIKSNEYLEKIFDLSFTMPKYDDIRKLVKNYFNQDEIDFGDGQKIEWISFIAEFFEALNETNPRRVKKVLNKYYVLTSIKNSYQGDLPNIYINKDSRGAIFETILVLYIIILHEFYQKKYNKLFDLNYKGLLLNRAIENIPEKGNHIGHREVVKHMIKINNVDEKRKFHTLLHQNCMPLIFSFLPEGVNDLGGLGNNRNNIESNYNLMHYQKMSFSDNSIDKRFLDFVIKYKFVLGQVVESQSVFSLIGIKNLIKKIL